MTSLRHWAVIALLILWIEPGQLLAQAETPIPTVPLAFNETVTGNLNGSGAKITYTFDIPPEQEIVIALESDRVIRSLYCIRDITGTSSTMECQRFPGGGGGDSPVSTAFVIPASESADARQTIDLTLSRPLDGGVRYQMAAYPVTPQALTLGETFDIRADAAHPYQVYALDANPTLPFSAGIEASAANGDFLWVTYEPYRPDYVTVSDERQVFPQPLDAAFRTGDNEGINELRLSYLGGQTFRLLVAASESYSLYSNPVHLQPLDADLALPVTVSYRDPLHVLRLSTDGIDTATIDVRVTEGAAAIVSAYAVENPWGDNLALGLSLYDQVPVPLSGTYEHVTSHGGLFVAVRIPFEFTHDQVTVEVVWQPDA